MDSFCIADLCFWLEWLLVVWSGETGSSRRPDRRQNIVVSMLSSGLSRLASGLVSVQPLLLRE